MDRNMLKGQVALVTGAGRGIGKACAAQLAAHGADVAILEIDKETAENAAREIAEKTGQRVIGVQADISREEDVKAAVKEVEASLGGVDILVNNAGICYTNTPGYEENPVKVLEISEEHWNRTMDINLKGQVYMIRAVYDHMAKQKYGRIIGISSQSGKDGGILASPEYGCSKAGVIALTKRLAVEFGKAGITVNNIAPGCIVTEMTEDMDFSMFPIPVGRVGTVDDIGYAVLFLASKEAGFISGVSLDVSGADFID